MQCLYDQGHLDEALTYTTRTKSMKVILFFQYFNRSYEFPFRIEAWDRSGFPDNDNEVDLYIEYLENVTKIK